MQQRRLRRDLDDLGNVADLHRNVDAHRALDFDRDGLAGEATKSGFFDFDPVLTGHEVDELIISRVVGLHYAPLGCFQVCQSDVRLWNGGRRTGRVTVPTIDP